MTPTTIAETILRDVPRYASPDGNLLAEEHVLAALTAAMDPAHVNETPKSEHDAGNVLTAAQAREAALVEALTNLPAVYAHQINTGVREVYDPLQRFYTMESVLTALKGASHD